MEIEFVITESNNGASQHFSTALTDRLLLGRDLSSPISFRGTKISREHFELLSKDSRILLRDLSSNGTWVNGQRAELGSECEIRDGDLVEIPGYRLEVRVPDQKPLFTPPPVESSKDDELPPRLSLVNPVYALIHSFGLLESFVFVGAICSLSIVLLYLAS